MPASTSGINAQRDRRLHAFGSGDPIDRGKFRFALDVETQNALVERIFDLLLRFADTGEGAVLRITAGCENTEQFAAGHDVESRALPSEQIEDSAIRIRFDGIADEVIDLAQRRIEPAVVVENRARAVDIERRAVFLGHALQIHAFAVEAAVLIVERVHGREM